MKYVLSEEEFKDLTNVKAAKIFMEKKKLQALCTKIADTMPIVWSWKGHETPMPWKCIHSIEDLCWYCDECPVSEICPEPNKVWSK